MDRFDIAEVYGMHNMPGLPVGEFAIRSGPIMASTDEFRITVTGKGAHAAMPHQGVDPVLIASQIVVALQSIVSRNLDPFEPLVVSATQINGGSAFNVIPESVEIVGTIRSLSQESREFAKQRMKEICDGIAVAGGGKAQVISIEGYPVTFNHESETEKAVAVARMIAGDDKVDTDKEATMGGEDFSYMLLERPGAFIFMGNGDSAGLHHPEYDFNDEAIPHGTSYWAKLVENLMPAA